MASSSLLPHRWASLAARLPAALSQRVERIALFDSYDRRSAGQLTVDDLRRADGDEAAGGGRPLLERFQTAMELADGDSDDEPPPKPEAEESKPAAKAKGKKGKKGRE